MQTALIVDDSSLARLTLKRCLEKYNVKAFEADCVADCRYWFRHNDLPDMVFMDISMPGEDGFDGLAFIREGVETKNLPVIMYSGDSSDTAKRKAREGRATGFLSKPVNETHLENLLRQLDRRNQMANQTAVKQPQEASAEAAQPVPASVPSVNNEAAQELRSAISRTNMAMEHQQDELSVLNTKLQRYENDLTHMQNIVIEQDKRIKRMGLLAILATVIALASVAVSVLT